MKAHENFLKHIIANDATKYQSEICTASRKGNKRDEVQFKFRLTKKFKATTKGRGFGG